ncbi:MAG: CvpA family protein [Thermodesulfobacteriota bacterium]
MWRGFISQVFSVLALLVVGLAAGIMFYGRLGQALMERGVVENEPMANVIAFVALVVVFYIAVQLIGWLTAKLTGALQLGLLNRLAGGARRGLRRDDGAHARLGPRLPVFAE